MQKADYCVYRTSNYKLFNQLPGNRQVADSRANVIKKSIEKVGFVHNPIIVNEKYQIVEGQGRFEALKRLGMPVDFILQEGIGLEECRAMNMNQKNWGIGDWIDSYADLGIQDYIYLRNLTKMFKRVNLSTVTCAVSGGTVTASPVISRGDFTCTTEQYEKAIPALSFVDSLMPFIADVPGRKDILSCAIIFVFMNEHDADLSRFEKVFKENYRLMPPVATLESCFLGLESIYNKRYRGVLCNFANDYKSFARKAGLDLRTSVDRKSDYMRKHNIDSESKA